MMVNWNENVCSKSFSGGHDGEDADANERSNYTADDIYDRYNFNMRTFSNYNLPIMLHEREILDAIETNQAIVLQAATGSGKTTQVSDTFSIAVLNRISEWISFE